MFRDILDRMRMRYEKQNWVTRIDAVEVWRGYMTPVHQYVYDNIAIGDIRDLVINWPDNLLDEYEFIFLGDIIEHMTIEDGKKVLENLQHRVRPAGEILVSTPVAPHEQGAYLGNEHETHVSKWTLHKLRWEAGFRILEVGEELITAYWIAPAP